MYVSVRNKFILLFTIYFASQTTESDRFIFTICKKLWPRKVRISTCMTFIPVDINWRGSRLDGNSRKHEGTCSNTQFTCYIRKILVTTFISSNSDLLRTNQMLTHTSACVFDVKCHVLNWKFSTYETESMKSLENTASNVFSVN